MAPHGLRFRSLTAPCTEGVCALAAGGRQTIEIVADNNANLDNQRVVIERGAATASSIRRNRFDLQSTGTDEITLSIRESATGALLDSVRVPVAVPTAAAITAMTASDPWGLDQVEVGVLVIARGANVRVTPYLGALRADGTFATLLDADARLEANDTAAVRVARDDAQPRSFAVAALAATQDAIAVATSTHRVSARVTIVDSPDEILLQTDDAQAPQQPPSPWSVAQRQWHLLARFRGMPVMGAQYAATFDGREAEVYPRIDRAVIFSPRIAADQDHVHAVFRSGDAVLRGRFVR